MRSVRSHIGHMDINTDIRTDNVICRGRFAPEKKNFLCIQYVLRRNRIFEGRSPILHSQTFYVDFEHIHLNRCKFSKTFADVFKRYHIGFEGKPAKKPCLLSVDFEFHPISCAVVTNHYYHHANERHQAQRLTFHRWEFKTEKK